MTDIHQHTLETIDAEPVAAELADVDGRWVLTMTRDFAYPPERLWIMLTDPVQLRRWSPIVPDRSLATIGPGRAREQADSPAVDLEVLVADAPRELVHRWGTHLLRWILAPTETGTRLTLSDTLDEYADGPRNGAGWHICLAVLSASMDDPSAERVVGQDSNAYGWSSLHDRYQDILAG